MRSTGQYVRATLVANPGSRPVVIDSQTNSVSKAATWGWLPFLSLLGSLGILLVSLAYTGSRAGIEEAALLFWGGLLMLVMPIAGRLASAAPSRGERIGLVVILMCGLYLIKVMHSPTAFTFSDELAHIYNSVRSLQDHHLFGNNPILAVTPLYPGLQTVTTALASVSGISPFSAGIVVIGAARLIFALALFLFFEQVSGSARVASLAAVLYTANFNFVFWLAQFAYESVALPLATLVLFAIFRRESTDNNMYRIGLTVTGLLAATAVTVTHHMTSYMLVAFFGAVSIVHVLLRKNGRAHTWGITLILFVAAAAWLIYVASRTIGYLSPVLSGAVTGLIRLIAQEEAARQLFQSSSGGGGSEPGAPLWERITGIVAMLLLLLGMPFGLFHVWRQERKNPTMLVLAGAALAFFGMLTLRFTSSGWETSNRASEFLFFGVAFIVALGIVRVWPSRGSPWIKQTFVAIYVAVIFMGGIIAGWQPNVRLARPYQVVADNNYILEPQGVAAATWTNTFLGPDNRIAADQSNARLLLAYGEQNPLTGRQYGISAMFQADSIDQGERFILQTTKLRYVLVDRRRISWDALAGYYFNHVEAGADTDSFESDVYAKWDSQANVDRIFDSGNIVIYDVGELSGITSIR